MHNHGARCARTQEYVGRTRELLDQLHYAPHDSLVLCAHNDTLQELLRSHLHVDRGPATAAPIIQLPPLLTVLDCMHWTRHEEARERHADLLSQLCPVAPPCSLLWVCFDFRRGSGRQICDLALVTPLLHSSLGGVGE